ncbi:MAG: S-adenosylmethionine:tRNA ribosyltransferase-isomerase [Myxococcota bacterium]
MRPATSPRGSREARLLLIDRCRRSVHDRRVEELPTFFGPGDVVVLNDSGTLPASLRVRLGPADFEVRLLRRRSEQVFEAALLGAGDWRLRTEARPAPPTLPVGARLGFGSGLSARLIMHCEESERHVMLRFDQSGAEFYEALYRLGRPIQYAHLDRPLELWDVQNSYAGAPWSMELPSAGRSLTVGTIQRLRERGVRVVSLTHEAGVSSTGDPAIDARLPLPERYRIPEVAARAVNDAEGAVIAVGTSVVRALESAAIGGVVQAGGGVATLRIEPHTQLHVVNALLTGMHQPGESHYELVSAFVGEGFLEQANRYAADEDYLAHEFGDSTLIACDVDGARANTNRPTFEREAPSPELGPAG